MTNAYQPMPLYTHALDNWLLTRRLPYRIYVNKSSAVARIADHTANDIRNGIATDLYLE